ncbi:Beta-xylosidase [Fusarium oxysporum f. sp. albedinis]|nr:Beta-xylosidase [Fusarium oxysporum f. sp. albedinis]
MSYDDLGSVKDLTNGSSEERLYIERLLKSNESFLVFVGSSDATDLRPHEANAHSPDVDMSPNSLKYHCSLFFSDVSPFALQTLHRSLIFLLDYLKIRPGKFLDSDLYRPHSRLLFAQSIPAIAHFTTQYRTLRTSVSSKQISIKSSHPTSFSLIYSLSLDNHKYELHFISYYLSLIWQLQAIL